MRTAWASVVYMAFAVIIAGCTTMPTTTTGREMVAETLGIPTGFINKTLEMDGEIHRYAVYVPREYDPAQQWPLILFLHGSGQRGDDGLRQTGPALGEAVRKNPDRWPAVIVMPQCPDGVWWDKAIAQIDRSLEQTLAEYSIDPKRIYLTGISMGGYATWIYGARHADRFAALMPVCGGGDPADAEILATLPIWAFHGAKDEVVLPSESIKMVEAVREAGGKVEYTEFEDAAHNSWDDAYAHRQAIRWLFNQSR